MIEPDAEGAAVLWEAGDSIKVQFLRDGDLYYAWLWTEEGGSSEAVFTTDYDILGGTDYIFFAPGYAECWEANEFSGERVFGVVIPPSQSAVADGVTAGITDGNKNVITPVDNYFGSKWGADTHSDMTANSTDVFNFVSSNCPDFCEGPASSRKKIEEVPVIILVNDSRYGGMTYFWSTGKAYCIIPWTYKGVKEIWRDPKVVPLSDSEPNGEWRDPTEVDYNLFGLCIGDWRNALGHEFGHAFGRLSDEYFSQPPKIATSDNVRKINQRHNWTVPYGRNVSASYSVTPWEEFLSRREELMAKDQRYSRIGKFQGGMGCTFGVWRSESISGMMDNRQYFNAWSRYLIVQRIMTLSGDLGSFSFDSWLARDVTLDPIRDGDGDGLGTRTAYRSPYRLQEPYYPVIWEKAIPFAPPVAMEE